jgi:hypothetical protein
MAFYYRIHNVAKAEFTGLSAAKERLGRGRKRRYLTFVLS